MFVRTYIYIFKTKSYRQRQPSFVVLSRTEVIVILVDGICMFLFLIPGDIKSGAKWTSYIFIFTYLSYVSLNLAFGCWRLSTISYCPIYGAFVLLELPESRW